MNIKSVDFKMSQITPIILAGGSGTRLWPLSRKSYPKQFGNLLERASLFQQATLRFSSNAISKYSKPIVVTNENFRFIVSEQLSEIGFDAEAILIEPEAKNTAPAILAATLYARMQSSDATVLIAPSDHVISDVELFNQCIQQGLVAAEDGSVVTFGIEPRGPKTGYGYLEVEGVKHHAPQKLKSFVEKPDEETAIKMLADGNFYWNSGIFMFKAEVIIQAFKEFQPEMFSAVSASVKGAIKDLEFIRLDPTSWSNCPNDSIDYAIMEQIADISVVKYAANWTDLGDWNAVWERGKKDENGVVLSRNATAIDCSNVLLRSEHENMQLVGLGLKNVVAVAMRDAVLVADLEKSQQVRLAVDELKKTSIEQAEKFPKDHRPWGWFETLTLSDRFQVKRIFVKPGAALSLQSHHHRSEHWIVVEGTAEVTIGSKSKNVTEGESVYIPLGEKHRLANPGKIPMILIEVQTGAYLREDDIIRYEDNYSRGSNDN